MKIFILLFFSQFYISLATFDELTRLPIDDFIEDYYSIEYAGPEQEEDYEEQQKKSKFKRYLKQCYNKVLKQPKPYNLYDLYMCQGYTVSKISPTGQRKLIENECLKKTQIRPKDSFRAFCEGQLETKMIPYILIQLFHGLIIDFYIYFKFY